MVHVCRNIPKILYKLTFNMFLEAKARRRSRSVGNITPADILEQKNVRTNRAEKYTRPDILPKNSKTPKKTPERTIALKKAAKSPWYVCWFILRIPSTFCE